MVALARTQPRTDDGAGQTGFALDAINGLRASPKRLAAKYFYDDEGSRLFERITEQPEYYPTRCEMSILESCAAEIGELIPPGAALVEFGSGSNKKVRLLLKAAPGVAAYVPVDISGAMLAREAAELSDDFPRVDVLPVSADFCFPFDLPEATKAAPVKVGFFPGSTIGNFEPQEAASFLRNAARVLGRGARLIIGVDLVKPVEILNAAYNDAAGVTAEFNLNLLARMNRELGGNFSLENFSHRAFFNRERGRIEMHLVSRERQKPKVAGVAIEFRAGETIHTENSYKYSAETFARLARGVGWRPVKLWTDAAGYFSIQAFALAD